MKSIVIHIAVVALLTVACQTNPTPEPTSLEKACQAASILKQFTMTAQYEALNKEGLSHTKWTIRTDSDLLNQYGQLITQEIVFSRQHGFTAASTNFLLGLLNSYLDLCVVLQENPQ